MALHEVDLMHNIIDVAFNASGSDFAVLHRNGISTYQYKVEGQSLSPPIFSRSYDLPIKDKILRQIRFVNESSIIVLGTHTLTGNDEILLTNLQLSSIKEFEFNHTTPISIIQPMWFTSAVLWLDINGGIGHILIEDGQVERKSYKSKSKIKLPSRMQSMETIRCMDREHLDPGCNHTSVVALATNGNLYYIKQPQDGEITLLAKGCTSFVISFPFIIITTVSHFLKFIRFAEGMSISLSE